MNNTTSEKLLLSAREAAKVLSISERTLWSQTEPRGKIPVVRMGSRVLYPVDALRQWIEQAITTGEGL
jgi:excisionase family DNA binding protein